MIVVIFYNVQNHNLWLHQIRRFRGQVQSFILKIREIAAWFMVNQILKSQTPSNNILHFFLLHMSRHPPENQQSTLREGGLLEATCLHIKSIERHEWTQMQICCRWYDLRWKLCHALIWVYCEAVWLSFMIVQRPEEDKEESGGKSQ